MVLAESLVEFIRGVGCGEFQVDAFTAARYSPPIYAKVRGLLWPFVGVAKRC